MNALARSKAILVDPAAAWRGIEKDVGDPAYLLSRYVAVLALIPALSSFVGATLVGVVTPSGAILRANLIDGLFGAVFSCSAGVAISRRHSSSRSTRSRRSGSPEYFCCCQVCVFFCSPAFTAFICSGWGRRD